MAITILWSCNRCRNHFDMDTERIQLMAMPVTGEDNVRTMRQGKQLGPPDGFPAEGGSYYWQGWYCGDCWGSVVKGMTWAMSADKAIDNR